MSKRFVIGDIKGNGKALIQVLGRSGFNPQEDMLICVGALEGYLPDTKKVLSALSTVVNLKVLKGWQNMMLYSFLKRGTDSISISEWYFSGGKYTLDSYLKTDGALTREDVTSIYENFPKSHVEVLNNMVPYYVLDDKVFIHASFDGSVSLVDQTSSDLYCSRRTMDDYLEKTLDVSHADFKNKLIYLGFVDLFLETKDDPEHYTNIVFMNWGAGSKGNLAMIDIDSEEVFCSDPVEMLYPEYDYKKSILRLETEKEIYKITQYYDKYEQGDN